MTKMMELSERIQEDLIVWLDGFDNQIIDGACQIVVDRFKDVSDKVEG